MSKVLQALEIIDFQTRRDDDHIRVSAIYRGKDKEYYFTADSYHAWLSHSGRLDATMDYNDPGQDDGHGQLAYKITPEEYWDISSFDEICEDLAMYIVRHDLVNSTDVFESLGQILKNQ